jgi:NAD+ synthase
MWSFLSRRRLGMPEESVDLNINAAEMVDFLAQFISDRTARAGKNKLVLGLSGGIDSAVAAALAVRALGPEGLFCLLMPSGSSNPDSARDALGLAGGLGVATETIDISAVVDAFTDLSGEVDRVRLGNVMARARMIMLFDRSAKHDALVLGTSNRSEILLGYGTLHGDLACAFNPLGDLYKTQIRALAVELGIPQSIRSKRPSADLWQGQSDEDELGFSYERIDCLLALLADARAGRAEAISHGFAGEMVDWATRMIVRSLFKSRMPEIARLPSRPGPLEPPFPNDWKF